MNKTTEALKLAEAAQTPLKDILRAVPKDGSDLYEEDKFCHHNIPYGRLVHEALAEIERLEALAEPVKQEPVAWVSAKESFCGFPKLVFSETKKEGYKPLYAAPVAAKAIRAEADQQGRNDMKEEAAKMCEARYNSPDFSDAVIDCADAIRGLK